MQTQYQKVREFMQAFGQECPERVEMQNDNTCAMRARLHREESVTEFSTACIEGSVVGVFDSVLDSLYALLGTAVAFGINEEMIARGFAEVHRSNMSKFWTDEQVHDELEKIDCKLLFIRTPQGSFIAKDPSGKIIKSPSYSPANLGPILEGKV